MLLDHQVSAVSHALASLARKGLGKCCSDKKELDLLTQPQAVEAHANVIDTNPVALSS